MYVEVDKTKQRNKKQSKDIVIDLNYGVHGKIKRSK